MKQFEGFKKASLIQQFVTFLIVLALVAIPLFFLLTSSPTISRQSAPKVATLTVEVLPVQAKDYPIKVHSFGTVQPRTQSFLVAQVAGQVMSVNSVFRPGGFFEKGDELLRIDDRDYVAEVEIAKATLIAAEQGLQEEEARSAQALHDWQRLEQAGEPSALVLRKPQLKAAQANLLSAQARLAKAELALSRTRVIAPFAGRVLQQLVDVGRVVGLNTQLAQVYATDYVEIRLPINNRDLALLHLPEEFRGGETLRANTPVTLHSELMGKQVWQAKLVRTEGAIDANAQQLYVVAQIDDPFSIDNDAQAPSNDASMNLRIGQYVTAEIQGKVIAGAIAIPNQAIYQGSYVYVLNNNKAYRRNVSIRWQNSEFSLISDGLSVGESVITTPLGQVNSGTPVQLRGAKKRKAPRKSRDASDSVGQRSDSKTVKGSQGVRS